jgi:hypothetical protein
MNVIKLDEMSDYFNNTKIKYIESANKRLGNTTVVLLEESNGGAVLLLCKSIIKDIIKNKGIFSEKVKSYYCLCQNTKIKIDDTILKELQAL